MVWGISDYIKTEENGNSYTWSCTAFKEWKRKLKRKYKEVTWNSLKQDVPSSWDREALYKRIFNMEWLDIFWNQNKNNTSIRKVDETILDTCIKIRDII